MDGALSYLFTVKKAFHDEPEKYDKFLKTIIAFKANSVSLDSVIARMKELMKDHLNLLLGLNAFLPDDSQITIPPEAGQYQNLIGRSVPQEPTMDDATSYLTAVKEAFHDEPEKYVELIKLLNDFRARRVDAASVITRVEELMKDHQNLLLGFSVFLSAKTKFIRKLKARFQGHGPWYTIREVYSILQILRMYKEGLKSKTEAFQEVFAILRAHGDLIMEFSEIFSGLTNPSGSTSTRP